MDKTADDGGKESSIQKKVKDYAISLFNSTFKRKTLKYFTNPQLTSEIAIAEAKSELDVINKVNERKAKDAKINYVFIDFSFNSQTILNLIKNDPTAAIIFIDDTFPVEKKESLTKEFKNVYFQNVTGMTLDIFKELLLSIKLDMTKLTTSKERYVRVKELGRGASGIVDLYLDSERNDKLVAVKTISTKNLNEETRLKVEREMEMVNLVKAPTIIEFFETKTDGDSKIVYMEYANGGSLEDKLKARNKGLIINQEEVFDWILEVSLGLYVMNLNDMIHRDIKSENILLADGIAKLADLGIARTIKVNDVNKTFCGTPFYASPEMVLQTDYSFNSDVWSLGVVLYELLAPERPFTAPTNEQKDLINAIVVKEPKPLPDDIDIRLRILAKIMLDKNKFTRPTIEEILRIDFVQDRLKQILEPKQLYMPCLDKIFSKGKLCHYDYMNLHNNAGDLELALSMSQECPLEVYKGGFFSSKISQVVKGSDLLSFLEEKNIDKPEDVIDRFIELGILNEISHPGRGFMNSDSSFYKFSFEYFADSKISNFQILNVNPAPHYDLMDISNYAMKWGIKLWNTIAKAEDPLSVTLENEAYYNFLIGISLFQKYKINSLEVPERRALLLNVYQLMMIHSSINILLGQVKKAGMLSFLKNNPEITYQFADFTLNNLEIKHVIFRGNKKPPNNYLRLVSDGDAKLGIIDPKEVQNHVNLFVLQEFPHDLEAINHYRIYNFLRKDVNSQIEIFMIEYCRNVINFEPDLRNVTLPLHIKPYIDDFSSNSSKNSFFGILSTFYVMQYQLSLKEKPVVKKDTQDGKEDLGPTVEEVLKRFEKSLLKVNFE